MHENKEEVNNPEDTAKDFHGVEKKEYGNSIKSVSYGPPIPGYAGTTRRVVPANIFGQTFANSLKTANNDLLKIKKNEVNNFINQLESIPDIKK